MLPFSMYAQEKDRMNVLLITADDLNFSSVGFQGCKTPDITPHLDSLAAKSHVFQNAHVNIAVSQPSRACLHTGRYSHNNGVEAFNHTSLAIPTLMSELRKAGYVLGVAGKVSHSTPHADFEWDIEYEQRGVGQGRNPDRYAEVFRELINESRNTGRPFYFCANSHDPHRPFHGSKQEQRMKDGGISYPAPTRVYRPDEVDVPAFLPDLPGVREELAQYYSSVRRLDDTVGAILDVLNDEGLERNTLIVFLSDNGMSIPFAKTNCYDNSTRTPLLIRWPGITEDGVRDEEHLVMEIDYMPTVLDICGIAVPDDLDGRSLMKILQGKNDRHRNVVFTQFYETSARNRYPMFKVQTDEYMYIFNPWSDGECKFQNDCQGGPAFRSMVNESRKSPDVKSRVNLFWYRVREELYDARNDRDALNNLAEDAGYAKQLKKMRKLLLNWMRRENVTAYDCLMSPYDEDIREDYMQLQKSLSGK